MAKNIQIVMTDEEYSKIKAKAEAQGFDVAVYIKSTLLGGEDDFTRSYKQLLELVQQVPSGLQFTIKALFGVYWDPMDNGIKRALGKAFYRNVKQHTGDDSIYGQITALDGSKTNIMQYIKK